MNRYTKSILLIALLVFSSIAMATTDTGTGAPQPGETVTLINWLLSWLPL